MSHVVAKPFNTAIQRFKVGATVSESDDLAPHTIESLKAGGFISVKSASVHVDDLPRVTFESAAHHND